MRSAGNDGKGNKKGGSPFLAHPVVLCANFSPLRFFTPIFYTRASEEERGTQAYETNPTPRAARILAKTCKIKIKFA